MAALASSSMRVGSSSLAGTAVAARAPGAARPRPFGVVPVRASQSLQGKVVGVAQDKTAMVEVTQLKIHPVYSKRTRSTSKYAAHDEKNECKVGDVVVLAPCPPLSKTKRFVVESVVQHAQ